MLVNKLAELKTLANKVRDSDETKEVLTYLSSSLSLAHQRAKVCKAQNPSSISLGKKPSSVS
jgi:hypothetical protein